MKKLFALVPLLVFGLLSGGAFAQDDGPIRIGVNLELSGRLVSLGTPELEGARAALAQQPEVLGRSVEFSVCDNQSTPRRLHRLRQPLRGRRGHRGDRYGGLEPGHPRR